jgi:hypothetical protein
LLIEGDANMSVTKIAETEKEKELLDCLIELVNQTCRSNEGDILDSCGISEYANAMRLLKEYNIIRINVTVGRRILGNFITGENV